MRLIRSLAASLVPLLAACSPDGPSGPPAEVTALPRPLTAQEAVVIEASNRFAFGLLRTVVDSSEGRNVFLSPLSASMALGMTANGAAGETRAEMLAALGFGDVPIESVNGSYRSLIDLLRGLDRTVDFRLANSIWYRADFPFSNAFLETGRQVFDAEVEPVTFDQATVDRINGWVEDATGGKITEMVGSLDPNTVMILLNAIYFKGQWRRQFDPRQTADAPFTPATGAPQTVKMMHADGAFPAYHGQTYDAVDLAYGASAFSMTVLLPKPGISADQLVASLHEAEWARLTSGLTGSFAVVRMPRFRLEFEKVLNGTLQALGMRRAFVDGEADFTAMSPTRGRALSISEVKQKSFVDVNEEGTEAAAATSVSVRVTSMPQSFRVDRPFVFAIRERLSGTILFVGRVTRIP